MWRDDAYLLDMLIAARDVQEFSSGLTRAALQTDRLHQQAIMRSLEIIG